MIHLCKILFFIALFNFTVQNNSPEDPKKLSNANLTDPASVTNENQTENAELLLKNETSRRSGVKLVIKLNPTFSSKNIITSISGHTSSNGHSLHRKHEKTTRYHGASEIYENSGAQSSFAAAEAKASFGGSSSKASSNSKAWAYHKGGDQENILIQPIFSKPSLVNNNKNYFVSNSGSGGTLNKHRIVDQTINANNWGTGGNAEINNNNWSMRKTIQDTDSDYFEIRPNDFNTQPATAVSVALSNDGLHANDFAGTEQNVMTLIQEPNSQFIKALPIRKTRIVQEIIGYKPNVQYYLDQINTRELVQRILSVHESPKFLNTLRPGQVDIHLTRPQLEMFKQYLIDTGLIQLKPYRLIFSDKYQFKLPSLVWMVVHLELSPECQSCGNLYQRDTLFGAFSRTPVRLLVPILKIRQGMKKTIVGTKTVVDGLEDISEGTYKMALEGAKVTQDLPILPNRKSNTNNKVEKRTDKENEETNH